MHSVPLRYGFVIENDNTNHIIENDEPTTYSKAVISSDSDKWLNTMKSEMDSMYANKVRMLVDAPEGVIPIGYCWCRIPPMPEKPESRGSHPPSGPARKV